jgi:hypothetical protein
MRMDVGEPRAGASNGKLRPVRRISSPTRRLESDPRFALHCGEPPGFGRDPMNSRQFPRIQLPIEVELTHPSIGKWRRLARDVSEGGVFVVTESGPLRPGAKIKLTVVSAALVESTPTPTIDMEVVRVTDDGLGLKFVNTTSQHLWSTVQRLRNELQIGRDYFQVFQGALVLNAQAKLLVVQQHGKWLFPGDYLVVGDEGTSRITDFLTAELGLEDLRLVDVVGADSGAGGQASEAATFSVFYRYATGSDRVRLKEGSRYRQGRWVGRTLSLEELTFSHPVLRTLAVTAFDRVEAERRLAATTPAADAARPK